MQCLHPTRAANRRIEELEGEIDTFLNEEANAKLVYEDPEEADAFRRQHNSRDVPLRFSVTAGEVLYHLRSSLDHLACDLIRRNGGCVTPQSQFPIFTFKPTKRKGMARYRDQVSGIAAEPAAMIEALQPYHRGEDGSAHFLAVLKSLSNFDKHNSLVLQSVRLKPSPKGVIGNDVMSLTTTRRDHGTLWRLNSGSGFEVMKMQRQLTACVMLGSPADLGGLPVIDVLRALHLFNKRTCMALRRAIREYVAHYHHERNHKGLDNELIVGVASPRGAGTVRRAQRLGGLLNFYHRAA